MRRRVLGRKTPSVVLNTAYVGCGSLGAGLVCVDVSDPSSMSIIGSIDTGNYANVQDLAIDTQNEIVYVADVLGGIVSVDVSDPTNPIELDNLTGGNISQINCLVFDAENSVLYASENNNKILTIDVSNPSSLSESNSFTDANLDRPIGAFLDSVNSLLYVAMKDDDGVMAIDVSIPASPSRTGFLTNANLNGAEWVAPMGQNTLVVASTISDNISTVDRTTPASMSYSDSETSASAPPFVASDEENEVAYLVDRLGDRIFSYDCSTPSSISLLDTFTDGVGATGLDNPLQCALNIDESLLFVTSSASNSITAIDISNPSSMSETGYLSNATTLATASRIVLGP